MRSGDQWTGVVTDEAPRLIVGWRPKARALDARRVEMHEDAADALREVMAKALERLARLAPVPYGPATLPVDGEEYLALHINDLPPRAPERKRPLKAARPLKGADKQDDANEASPHELQGRSQSVAADEAAQLADLLRLIRNPDELPEISSGQLADGEFTFYAISLVQPNGEVVTGVRGTSPTRVLKRGAFFGRFAGSLRRSERPDLVLESGVDLLITGDEIAITNRLAFDRLFSDLDALSAKVPADVSALQTALPNLQFAPGTADVLTRLCQRLPSLAKRLGALTSSPGLSALNANSLTTALQAHGEQPGHWLDQTNELTLTEDRARQFLDLVEGRWWTSDFTGERRRADAFRRR